MNTPLPTNAQQEWEETALGYGHGLSPFIPGTQIKLLSKGRAELWQRSRRELKDADFYFIDELKSRYSYQPFRRGDLDAGRINRLLNREILFATDDHHPTSPETLLVLATEAQQQKQSLPLGTAPVFHVGEEYHRGKDIHSKFGGQEQGGIATPTSTPVIFLFTGEAGEQHGYSDGWDGAGVFHYTGEGQVGDMAFMRGNRAILNHSVEGKDLLLFEQTTKPGTYRFLGRFDCANWEYKEQPDREQKQRQAIVFHLVPAIPIVATSTVPVSQTASLLQLRANALAAAQATQGSAGRTATRSLYERSIAVAKYVLARAKGQCEACGEHAPFTRIDGSPYLECHHTRRLSDGGPDHPQHVGAVCPTCHRRIHYGVDGASLNEGLIETLAKRENIK